MMARAGGRRLLRVLAGCAIALLAVSTPAEPLPAGIRGAWRITNLLPTTNTGCWTARQAAPLVGSTLVYEPKSMSWKDGTVPLLGVSTRTVDNDDLKSEFSGDGKPVDFGQLRIRQAQVLEVNLQHEDADITGASTEVPGDSVLLAEPNRIVGSVCGVYFEATRLPTARAKSRGRQ